MIDYALPGNYAHPNEKALTDRGIHVIHYGTASKKQLISEVKEILIAGNYDIVHIMQGYLAIDETAIFTIAALLNRKRCGYKIILHAHGTADASPVPLHRLIKRDFFRFLLRRLFNLVDIKAACSPPAGDFLFGKEKHVLVLYNGIDLKRFSRESNPIDVSTWRNKYNIPEDRLNLITVGRFSEEKNPFFILDIINAIKAVCPNVLLTWVGEGKLQDAIIKETKRLGLEDYINFLGRQTHVEEILHCCNSFILPSKREGAPLTLIEAQAVGLDVYASKNVPKFIDCGGCLFIDLDCGAEAWANVINDYIKSMKLARSIKFELVQQFDIERTSSQLEQLYDGMVGFQIGTK